MRGDAGVANVQLTDVDLTEFLLAPVLGLGKIGCKHFTTKRREKKRHWGEVKI